MLSAIPSKYSNEEILKYKLPYIIENKNINTKIQHPLAEIEIDCIDSSYAKIIFKDEKKFDAMCRELNHHETEHSEKYYYEIRNLDRDKKKFNKLADYKRAARTIYLNKACFNGLYRVNSKNEFNVPFGKKTKVNTYEGQNLGIICGYLNYNDVKLLSVDFEEAVKDAKKGDFIYFDPPYDSDTSTFNSYTEDGFGKEEQKSI